MSDKVLIACEESQAVTIEFRKLGIEAYSCDIIDCSGKHPEWHIKGDAIKEAYSGKYDMMIAFPPCTHLAVSGAKHFEEKRKDGRQQQAIDFFMKMVNVPINKIAIENPVGIMSTIYKKPTQIIQPYFFGDEYQKTTCLWLKGLQPLLHVKEKDLFNNKITHVGKGEMKVGENYTMPKWFSDNKSAKIRSKTFPGIAKAMAVQWSKLL